MIVLLQRGDFEVPAVGFHGDVYIINIDKYSILLLMLQKSGYLTSW